MACLQTLVNAARQRFVTRETTRDLGDVARYVATQLVSAMTPLLSELRTRRTLRLTVTSVLHLDTHTSAFDYNYRKNPITIHTLLQYAPQTLT